VVGVEQWAELRRLHFVRGLSIREIHRRTGIHRETISRALRSDEPPRYERQPRGSKLDPFKDEIHRLLAKDPKLPGVVVRDKLEALGFTGSKTIVDHYLREVRPLHLRTRTHRRTIYRPGKICQFDLWEPSQPIPVGHGELRKGFVVVACLGYSRAGSGALVFSKQTEDLLSGICALPLELRRAPRDGRLGPPGGNPRPRWPPDPRVRRPLRPAEARLALLPAGRPAGEGRRRAPAGLPRDELRAGPQLRQRA
jgi:hypothetical protein